MRIALIVHGLPPQERTGVETHVEALAGALARSGCEVRVLAARKTGRLPHLAERRELRGGFAIDWLELGHSPRDVLEEADPPGVAAAVGEWLERERPDLLHVQHVRGLGWGLLEVVRARGLPLVFTAHDYYAVCHRVTLLRPDLTRCTTVGDAQLCARCDRAVAQLHAWGGLGDWHMGVLPEQLGDAARLELARALEATEDDEAARTAQELRARADALRGRALAAADLVLAPTQRVAAALLAGGLDPRRVRLHACGIATGELRGSSAQSRAPHEALRVGFVGGLAKHKGAHVLVEACRDLPGVELHLHGDSSDRPYVERLRARCAETGATWHGAFAAGELPEVLAGLDLLCVPSLWEENAPFVIREAFAAGRPVLASDLGALPESVRDGVDGRLVAPGDVAAWRAAIGDLARDRNALRALAARVRPPRELDEQVGELLGIYTALLAAKPQREPALPAHLLEFEQRRQALAREPFETLHARVRAGVTRLREGLGLPAASGAEPDSALLRARELLRDRRREAAWLRSAAADDRTARTHLAAEAAWLRGLLGERERELAWRGSGADDLRGELERVRAALSAESAWLSERVSALSSERDWLRSSQVELERERADHSALAQHERWLRAEAERWITLLGAREALPAGDTAELARALDDARLRAAELLAELAWRRAEMERALGEGGALVRACLAPSSLGKRMEAWRAAQGGPLP
jgi:glycosyltransferase involved in cell wall biosynthesis